MERDNAEFAGPQIELFAKALDKVGETIFLMGENSPKFLHVNETAARTLGYTREELIGGMSVYDIDPHWTPEAWARSWPELCAKGTLVIETEHRTKGGRIFPVELTANYFEFGGQKYNLAICRDISDRKQAENALRKSETQFRNLVESWPDEIARYDLNCRRVYVNPMMEASLGAASELLGRTPTESYPDSVEIAFYERKIREVIETGLPATFDMDWGAPAIHPKYRTLRLVPERDTSGTVIGVFAIARDISERKRAEELTRVSEERLNEAQHLAHIGSWVWRPDNTLEWSETMYELFGVALGTKPDMALFLERVHPEDREEVVAGFQEWIADESDSKEAEYRIILPDGSIHSLVAIGKKELDEKGNVTRAFGTCQDITERKLTAEKLSRANAKIVEILESITDAFIALDHECRFTYVNTIGAQRAGMTPAEMIGKKVSDLFPGHPPPEVWEAMKDGVPTTLETYVEQLGGWYESHLFPTKEGLSIYSRDISERKRWEMELARLNRALRMLSDSNQALLFIDNESVLLQQLCDIAVEVGGYGMAWVGYAEPGKEIRPVAHAGIENEGFPWTGGLDGKGPAVTVVKTGKADFIRDAASEAWATQLGFRSVAALPLTEKDKAFGVFCVYSNEADTFDENEIAILTELAGDLSFGLRTMQVRAERERVQAALRKQMRMDEAMFSQAITCFALFDRDYKVLHVNESYAKYYGKTAADFVGTTILDMRSAGQSLEDAQEMIDAVVRSKQPMTSFAYPYLFPDQPERGITYWDATLQPILDEDGEVEFLFFSSIDVTERKRAELQIQSLTEHSPDVIARFDRELRYIYANATMEKISGIAPGDLIGRRYGEVLAERVSPVVPEEVKTMREAIASVFATAQPTEVELRLPLTDGEHDFNVRLVPEFDEGEGDREVATVLSIARDITERKQAVVALRSVLRHARTLVMHSTVTAPEGWNEHPPEWSAGRYHWESRFEDEATAQKVLLLDLLPGKSYCDAWHAAKYPEDEVKMHLVAAQAFVTGASNWYQEFRVADGDGMPHWFTQAAYVESAGDGRWRVTTINTDMTARKLAEDQVRANMARMELQESALIALTKKEILEGGDWLKSLRRLTETSAKALGVARVSLWRYLPGREVIRCIDLYDLDTGEHTEGGELAAVDYPIYFRELAECDVIAADDAQSHPQTQEFADKYLKPTGITSMLDVPIQLKGTLDGVLCHEHVGAARRWTSDERTFAIAMANFVTLILEEHERQRAQEELSQSQQAYASLVNTVDGIVWELDVSTFQFTFVSKQAERLLGYPTERWMERDFWQDHLHPEDREWTISFCLSATKAMRDHDFQYRMLTEDGRVVWLHDLVTVVVENGRPVKLRGIMVDITDSKLAEEERENLETQLRQAQKIEALGTLAGGIAHDFNNILGTILGNVDLALQDSRENPALAASLEQIRSAGHRARDLTQQILLFGRQQMTSRRVISLAPIVEQCVSLLRATLPARVTVQSRMARETPAVFADASQMLQVLVNLGTNAAHAIQARLGTIDIVLEAVTVDEVTARVHPDLAPGSYARISVTDTGYGMDAATQLRIFEPFFTTKQVGEGTGLGLSVVHGIVSSHDGAILVHSELGVGSTFELYLPAAQARIEETTEKLRPGPDAKGEGQHILCIDDDEPLVFLLKRMLERRGYRVSGYTNLREALETLRADPKQFDAVVTDYNMPGMSGLEVVRIIREIRPDLPVALASGYITEDLRTQAVAAGVTELIFKPNAVEEYSDVVARLVTGGGQGETRTLTP